MIYRNSNNNLFHSTYIDSYPFIHAFGTKQFGDGRNSQIVKQYLDTKQILHTHIVKPHQTHSTNVQIVSETDLKYSFPSDEDCDGLVTREKNVVLTVVTADCVPIIYSDPTTEVIAISHQGWKGTKEKLPTYVIEKMVSLGANPAKIRCAMGPAINSCCYHLALYEMNLKALQQSGVLKEHIDIFPFCTCCDEECFYSYRREGKITGEMIHFIMMS